MSKMLKELFGGSCTVACDAANLSPSLQVACDAGSQGYCNDASTINSVQCKTYLNRLSGTAVAERTNTTYAKKVVPTSGASVQSYLSGLASTASKFAGIGNNIASDDFAYIQQVFADAGLSIVGDDILNIAIQYAAANPSDAKFCSLTNTPKSWFATQIPTTVLNKYMTFAKNYLDAGKPVVDIYDANPNMDKIHSMYPDVFAPLEDLVLSKIQESDFENEKIVAFRDITPRYKDKLDSMILDIAINSAQQESSSTTSTFLSRESFDPTNDAEIIERRTKVDALSSKIDDALKKADDAISALPDGMTKEVYSKNMRSMRNSFKTMKKSFDTTYSKWNSASTPAASKLKLAYMIDSYGNRLNDFYETTMKNQDMFKRLAIELYVPKPLNSSLEPMSLGHVSEGFMSKKEKLTVDVTKLTANTMIYNSAIQKYINSIKKKSGGTSSDSLVTLVSGAEDTILEQCKSGDNSVTDKRCLAMISKSTDKKDAMLKIQKDYCMSNVLHPKCVSLFNASPSSYDMSAVYASVLKKCVEEKSTDASCANENIYVGLSEYLKSNTSNITTLDTNSKVVDIVPRCTNAGPFSATNCAAICTKYPNVCANDAVVKCSLPKYRYASDSVDRFTNASETFKMPESEDMAKYIRLMYIVLFFIITLLVAVIMIGRYRSSIDKCNAIAEAVARVHHGDI